MGHDNIVGFFLNTVIYFVNFFFLFIFYFIFFIFVILILIYLLFIYLFIYLFDWQRWATLVNIPIQEYTNKIGIKIITFEVKVIYPHKF